MVANVLGESQRARRLVQLFIIYNYFKLGNLVLNIFIQNKNKFKTVKKIVYYVKPI